MSDPHLQATRLDFALDYLARGWPVFPVCRPVTETRCMQHGHCSNAGKVPLVKWERFQTELPTADEVREWWRRDATANIGMATGALSGIIVLDCDGGDARKVALDRGVPPTPTVFTGKPGGVHYHLAHPGFAVANFARKYADLPGIDFRGDGGYVLLPPSHHWRGADYRWVPETEAAARAVPPDWLLDRIHGRADAPTASDHPGLDLVALLDGVPEGERDDTLYRFACRLRGDDVPREYADFMVRQAARACRPAFDEDVAVDKVARAYAQYSPTLQLVVPAITPAALPAAYAVKQIGESRSVAAAVLPALIQGLLWSGKVHWLYSAPGAGKTMLMLAAAMHVAAGRPFGERRVEPGAVLLIEEDSPESVLGEYVTTLSTIYPDIPIDTIPLYYNAVQGLRLTEADGLEKVYGAIAACPVPPRLVVVDTCEKVLPSQEFSSRELAPLVTLCQELAARGIALVVIDHTRKAPSSAEKGKAATEASDDQIIDLLYGGRQKSGMSDVMLYLTGSLTRGKIAGRFVKFRGATPDPITLKWAGDTGFGIVEPPRRARTPSEEKVLKFLNTSSQAPFARRDVCAATGLSETSANTVLAEFVRRNWIASIGDGRSVQYTANDIAAPSTLELLT